MTDNEDTTPSAKLANAAKPAGQAVADLRDIELTSHDFTVEAIDASNKPELQFDEIDTWQTHLERIKSIANQNGFKFLEIGKESKSLSYSTEPYQQLKFRHKDYRTNLYVKTFIHGEMIVDFQLDYKDKRGGNNEK